MRMFRALLAVPLGIAVLGLGAPASPAQAAATPVKIMPLGASITWGTSSSDGNGYREELRRHLVTDAGIAIDYVGSQQSGTMADKDNEGHPGYRVDGIQGGADAWIAAARPDVVLLNVGTNDMLQNYDLANAPNRLSALLDQIVRDAPTATLVVSTLVPSPDATVNARVVSYNSRIPGIVQASAPPPSSARSRTCRATCGCHRSPSRPTGISTRRRSPG